MDERISKVHLFVHLESPYEIYNKKINNEGMDYICN